MERLLEQRRKFSGEQWSSANTYDAAIIVAGYGAFFALWAGVSDDITPFARVTTAFLMGISIALYIVWTMGVMVARHHHDREFAASMVKTQKPEEAFLEWDAIERKQMNFLQWIQRRLWMPFFGVTVLLGISGGLILIYNCLAVAAGLPQLTGHF
ncbi:hypothetical protein P1X14_06540 [Sphingomonas sp. AOB5]|uniref:hypothetical protein n=1 Tax=Sphingomonas sp. AOB5 TaxID=3034017 RepID=UPI0023F6C888|nr:hypothetical protein [Sphingomonas sp. AOB5]MDF7774895.1 hypothetical protein [Sphingomonas sp. AOB5]